MRSDKPYTNATFTRRVDHEAGRHRPPRAPAEPRVCVTCGAVYSRRRWVTAAVAERQNLPLAGGGAAPTPVRCPACRIIAHGSPAGMLVIDGDFPDAHADDVQALLDNEAARALEDNPLGRIIERRRDADGRLLVTTTTEHLAQRLGQALEKAFTGRVRYDFSHENKFARVYWHRD